MVVLNQGFEAFLHSLLPAKLQQDLKTNTAAYIRARALTIMLISVTALGAFSTLTLSSVHFFTNPPLLKHDLVLFGILAALLFQTVMFYKFCNTWVSGLAFTNFYFVGVVLLLILAGGYEFHGKIILLTCPMISFVVGSRQEGIQNSFLSIVFFWVLVFLHSIGFDLPDIFYARDGHLIFTVNWIFSVAVIAITLAVYETELQGRDAHLHLRANRTRLDTSQLSEWFENRMHKILPSRLRETLDRQSMEYARAQILTILLRIATAFCFLGAFLVLSIDLALHPEQFKYDIVILGVAVCFALQTWLFYKFNNVKFSGAVLSYFAFIVILIVVLISGGYESPLMAMMLVSPIAFFMVSGMRDGVINAVAIVLIGIVLAYLSYREYPFMDFFHDATPPITSAVIWFIAIIAIMICMMTYDTELEKL